jgi:hypothetical protein
MRRGPRSRGRRAEGSVRPVPAAPSPAVDCCQGAVRHTRHREGSVAPTAGMVVNRPGEVMPRPPPTASIPQTTERRGLGGQARTRCMPGFRCGPECGGRGPRWDWPCSRRPRCRRLPALPGCGGPRPSPRGRGDRRRGRRAAGQPRAGRRRRLTSGPGAAAPAVGPRRVPRPHGERPPRRADQPAASLLRGRRLAHSTHRMTGRPRGPGRVVGATAGRHVGGRGHRGATTAATATAPRDPVSRAGRPAAPPCDGAGAGCPARSTRSTRASPSRW